MTDTAKLIAQARELDERGALSGLAWQLAAALEAAEAERDEALRQKRLYYGDAHACEAENRRLREALEQAQAIQPRTLERLRTEGIVFKHAPKPGPDLFEHVAFWIYTDLCEVESIARAALAGSGE